MNTLPLLQARQLSHGWPGLTLFDRLDVDIHPGITLLTGEEGCGKSTLLRLLASREPGLTFLADIQHPALDNEPVAALLAAVPRGLIDDFGLAEHLGKPLYMLSTGSRRKVGLCQTLASPAPVLLIDQPVAALDPPSVRCLVAHLQRIGQLPGRAVVVADHESPPGLTPDHTVVLPAR